MHPLDLVQKADTLSYKLVLSHLQKKKSLKLEATRTFLPINVFFGISNLTSKAMTQAATQPK